MTQVHSSSPIEAESNHPWLEQEQELRRAMRVMTATLGRVLSDQEAQWASDQVEVRDARREGRQGRQKATRPRWSRAAAPR